MTALYLTAGLLLIGCAAATVVAVLDPQAARLSEWLSAKHLRCRRAHPEFTHDEWETLIRQPIRRAWYERHGIKP